MNKSFEAKKREIATIISGLERKSAGCLRISNKFSAIRLISFIIGAVITIYLFTISLVAGWISLAVFLFAFGIIVHYHNKLLEGMRRISAYKNLLNEDLARMDLEWEKLPGYASEMSDEADWIERDLDLYGSRSLHSLMDTTVSIEGSAWLRNFLHGDFPGISELVRRQTLVRSLMRIERTLRRFRLKAGLTSNQKLNCGKIESILQKELEYKLPGFALIISVIVSALIFISVISLSFGIYEAPIGLLLFVNLAFYFMFAGKTGKSLEQLNDIEPQITKLRSVTSVFKDARKKDDRELTASFAEFFDPKSEFHQAMDKLRRLSVKANYRENQILRLLLNIAFPYDFLLHKSLQEIVPGLNSKIKIWLRKLEELDCFCAVSGFALLNPDYHFTSVNESSEGVLNVRSISHPLMKRSQRITNDFMLSLENELVIITGSNMSGKSTFLRTIGINICLSNAGAPVPARELLISPWKLFTCIRVSDSVFDGISYFYSEVKRLKSLLDLLESNPKPKVLFFIDEIFKGTNNIERLKGSFAFLKKVSQMNCSGFITTHDIELVKLEEEVSTVSNYHFRESIEDGKMAFGYKIYTGPCPTTNALKIMKLSGLPAEE